MKGAVVEKVNQTMKMKKKKTKRKKARAQKTSMLTFASTAKMAESSSAVTTALSHTTSPVSFPRWNGSRTVTGAVPDVR